MSEVESTTDSEPTELDQLKHSFKHYDTALSFMAHADVVGFKARAVADCLDFFAHIRNELDAKIKQLEPEKPKEAPLADAGAEFKEEMAAA